MKKIYIIALSIIFITSTAFLAVDGNGVDTDVQPTKIVYFYPNPASSFINFEYTKPLEKGYTLQLYNFIGKKVYESVVSGSKTTITLEGFYRGIYIFQLRNKSGKIIESGKFQIVK
ncbi:MAG: T9SS type A sorting domain-containing protein [Chitinophagaceae bacterium]|nr:T9SS type A sorting domain-containing protein [Chitinophagaceae bacterium]MCW5905377.1 T9SS type A sorting domain-containing protein [Chitinophagaceae bacterium]